MIHYNESIWHCVFLSRYTLLTHAFRIGFLAALVSTAGFTVIRALDHQVIASAAWFQSYFSVVGFVLVFRTSQSYSRFWEGTSLLYTLLGDLVDGTGTVLAYTNFNPADAELVDDFRQRLVRLVSLLNAMIMGELEGLAVGSVRAHAYELLDLGAFDEKSLRYLVEEVHKPEVIHQWLQCLIVEGIGSGVLNIPPPLLTQVFQDFGNAMVRYHSVSKFARVPFPFPYRVLCELLVVGLSIMAPVVFSLTNAHYAITAFTTFSVVFMCWTMHAIAAELDNPFSHDLNDLDMPQLHDALNERLLTFLRATRAGPPRLVLDLSVARSRAEERPWDGARSFLSVTKSSQTTEFDGDGQLPRRPRCTLGTHILRRATDPAPVERWDSSHTISSADASEASSSRPTSNVDIDDVAAEVVVESFDSPDVALGEPSGVLLAGDCPLAAVDPGPLDADRCPGAPGAGRGMGAGHDGQCSRAVAFADDLAGLYAPPPCSEAPASAAERAEVRQLLRGAAPGARGT